MKDKTEQIMKLIYEVRRKVISQSIGKQGNSFPFLHFITLRFIAEKKPLMREVAKFLAITPPSATSLVNTLVNQGYIERIADTKDRRAVKIIITKKGKIIVKEHQKKIVRHVKKKFEKLSAYEQKSLINILNKLVK